MSDKVASPKGAAAAAAAARVEGAAAAEALEAARGAPAAAGGAPAAAAAAEALQAPKEEAPEDAEDPDDELLPPCELCDKPILEGEDTTTLHDKEVHKRCVNLKKRMQVIRSGNDEFSSWGSQCLEDRQSFMAMSAHLYGDDLHKAMMETIDQSRTQRVVGTFKASGSYVLTSEVGDLKRFKKDPVALAALLENGDKHTCKVTKQEFVWVPEYHFEEAKQEVNERKMSRSVTQESSLKRKPAARKQVVDKPSSNGMTAPLNKKVLAAIARHQESAYRLEHCLTDARDEAYAGWVSPGLINKAAALRERQDAALAKLEEQREKEKIDKVAIELCIQQMKDLQPEESELVYKIDGCIDEAPCAQKPKTLNAFGVDEPASLASGSKGTEDAERQAEVPAEAEAQGDTAAATGGPKPDRRITSKRDHKGALKGKGDSKGAAKGKAKAKAKGRARKGA